MNKDPATGSTNVVLKTPKGDKVFPRLRPSDQTRLKNLLWSTRREQILKNADDTVGRNSDRVMDQLNLHDSRPIDRAELVAWALNEGMLTCLAHAWIRTLEPPPQTEEERLTMLSRAEVEIDFWNAEHDDLVNAIAGIFNVKMEDKPKNPTQPAGSAGGRTAQKGSPTSTTTKPRSE